MKATLREARLDDAAACGRICHDAFEAIARQHDFPKDLPSREVAAEMIRMLISHPGIYAVVAEVDGRIIGSNFLDERSSIYGVARTCWPRLRWRDGDEDYAPRGTVRRRRRVRKDLSRRLRGDRTAAQLSEKPSLPRSGHRGLQHADLHTGIYAVVAEVDGCIIGSDFLDKRSSICGVGPITVDPSQQVARVASSCRAC